MMMPERSTPSFSAVIIWNCGSGAGALSGVQDRSALLAEALRALIERESARRLARLGGSEPRLAAAPRRQGEPAPKTRRP